MSEPIESLPAIAPSAFTPEELQRRAEFGLSKMLGKADAPLDVKTVTGINLAWRYVENKDDDGFTCQAVGEIGERLWLFPENGEVEEIFWDEVLGPLPSTSDGK